MKRNILIISPEYPPLTNWGGIATFCENFVTLQSKLNVNVCVLTFDGVGEVYKEKVTNSLKIIYSPFKSKNKMINFLYFMFPFGPFRYLVKRYLPEILFLLDWNFFSFLSYLKLNKKYNFTEVHTQSYYPPILISLFFRGQKYTYVQGPLMFLSQFESFTLGKKVYELIEKLYIKLLSPLIIACSNDVRKKLIKQNSKIKSKTIMIPNFIDTKRFINNKPFSKNNIVFWGRLDYRKGVDLLLKAFAKVAIKNKNIKLFLIGEKSHNFKLNGKRVSFDIFLESLKIPKSIFNRITIYPRIDDKNKLIKLLQSLKGIAVFPSRYEPFGFVNIEAMALGYLVATSATGSGKEIISDSVDGYIFEPKTFNLSQTLEDMLQFQKSKIIQITKRSIIRSKTFYDINSVLNKY